MKKIDAPGIILKRARYTVPYFNCHAPFGTILKIRTLANQYSFRLTINL